MDDRSPEYRFQDTYSCGHTQITELVVPFDRIGAWKRDPNLYQATCWQCRDAGKSRAESLVQVVAMMPLEPPFDDAKVT